MSECSWDGQEDSADICTCTERSEAATELVRSILSAALSDLTPEQIVALTMGPFEELREDEA